MASGLPACVVDIGTGYTKMGFAGNTEPHYIFPSTIAVKESKTASKAVKGIDELDFFIGDDCMKPETDPSAPKHWSLGTR